ncbi:alginate lyase family protein [Luteolibacter yonseiensis]|uniref:Alginate lyase family protein n=1 Tax=Luteolibacter yonseiensis TaxID=1144680 RepID=A0A934VDB3_9BACT|nr:alginate lyase family protein [Luteolibacter yonseiensis]MBK1817970.1 alginate lyase family protein [Luteolibacter yonseiensis]
MKFRIPALFVLVSILLLLGHQITRAQPFVHPGGLHTKEDLDRMRSKVAAREHPWIDGWNLFIKDPKAQDTYKARPTPDLRTRQRAQDDATAMYYNALRWYISGEKSHGDCAVRIANDWASKTSLRPYGDDLSGIPIGSFALAAEVLRIYPGWAKKDFEKFKDVMVKHWYPKSRDFLKNHRGGPVDRCWANWDACNMLAVLGIGVLCDDREKFNEAVEYFKNGPGMGSIRNAVPFVHPGGLGQWQEAGRDLAHTMGGQGLLAEFCQTAWNQGVDLFGYDDNRLMKGAEHTAQYTLWKGVPYTYYTNSDHANQSYISTNYKGRLAASHFELLYNHYVVRRGLQAPNIKAFAEMRRPEPSEIDVFGHGTLAFTLDASASPYPAFPPPPVPLDLTATAGIGRIDLAWSPSGAYTAHGYEVFRSVSKDGPFISIHSTDNWTTPAFTDTGVEKGKTYFYAVAALSKAGASGKSSVASAAAATGGALPKEWTHEILGKPKSGGTVKYDQVANHSMVIEVAGAGIGGASDGCDLVSSGFSGDCTLTARLIDRRGAVNRVGLMIRENNAPGSKALALTLGDVGGRQTRFGTRATTGGKMTSQSGNDYTWLPIWFRLQRTGDVFSAFQSPDGATWYEVGKSSVSMSKDVLIGLAASADGKEKERSSVAFDNLTLGVRPPSRPAAPTGLVSAVSGKNEIRLKWTNPANDHAGVRVEAANGDGIFYEIADLPPASTTFVNTGLATSDKLRYRIRAYNIGGFSEYSNATESLSPMNPGAMEK